MTDKKIERSMFVYVDSRGELKGLWYSRFERFVRAMGRRVGRGRLARYHERTPAGIAVLEMIDSQGWWMLRSEHARRDDSPDEEMSND